MRAEGRIWAREGGWNTQDAVCGRGASSSTATRSPQGLQGKLNVLASGEDSSHCLGKARGVRSRACIGLVEAPLTVAEELALIGGLSRTVSRLVDTFNLRIGDDFLYFTTCAGTFTLSAKRVDACDCRLANGILDVPVLVKLILTLQRAVEIERECEL